MGQSIRAIRRETKILRNTIRELIELAQEIGWLDSLELPTEKEVSVALTVKREKKPKVLDHRMRLNFAPKASWQARICRP